MPTIIATLQVEDSERWEKGFRTHADLFRSQTVRGPIRFSATRNNEVVIQFDVDNLDTYMNRLDSKETIEAMDFDGVKRETVKIFVLDKEFAI